jgi:hypothetical protein
MDSPRSQVSNMDSCDDFSDDHDDGDVQDLEDQIKFIDSNIKEFTDAIKAYKEERRDLMHKLVIKQYTRDEIINLTQCKTVTRIENCEVVIYNSHVHFESYYWLPKFIILIKAKIPVASAFLQEHDIPTIKEKRNWSLLKEFVTFELFDL